MRAERFSPLQRWNHTWRNDRGASLQAGGAARVRVGPARQGAHEPASPLRHLPSVVSQLSPPRKSLALGLQGRREVCSDQTFTTTTKSCPCKALAQRTWDCRPLCRS